MKNNAGESKVLLNMNVFLMTNHQYEKDKMRELFKPHKFR